MVEVLKFGLPGILPLGREGQEEVCAAFQASGLEDRLEHLVRGAGIRGGFEDDQLSRAQSPRDHPGRGLHIGEIGLAMLRQGRRHADQDGIGLIQTVEIGGRLEASLFQDLRHLLGRDVLDVALAPVEMRDVGCIDVETQHLEPRLGGCQRQRQAHVTEADDTNGCLAVANC